MLSAQCPGGLAVAEDAQYLQFRTHSLGGASAKCLMNFFVPLDTLSWPSLSLWRGDAEGDIAGVLRLRFFRACLGRTKRWGGKYG